MIGVVLAGHPASAQAVTDVSSSRSDAAQHARTASHQDTPSQSVLIVGTDIYPLASTRTDQPRFDPSSSLLANTVAAKTGLFGAAAREGLTWANHYMPGTDRTGVVQLYSLSTSGNYGALFGARSSDNTGSRSENVIGSISLVVADSDRPHLHWAHYSEGFVPRDETAFRLLINDENSIQNEGLPAPYADPYDVNPDHLLNNLRIDCGIGMGRPRTCTNPISVLNNGAKYRAGMIFGAESIELVDGAATAVALPADYGVSWFGASGRPAWRLYSTARTAGSGRLVMTDDGVSIDVGRGDQPALQVVKDAIRTPGVIASGKVPSMSGSCTVRDQRGGNAAGAFVLAQACPDGTITIGFSVTAANGWSCFASNLARGEAVLRETAYTPQSATLAVSRAQSSDPIVFSCTGF